MLRSLFPRKLDGDARVFGLGYLLLLPLYLAPLYLVRYLPGLDLPFHLALVDMLRKSGDPGDPYAAYYQSALGAAPYTAHYLLLRLLGAFAPLMTAQKVITGCYVAAFPLAAASLLQACGRSRIPALLCFPLAYNLTLHYGFISFALSLPVLLFLLGNLTRFLGEPNPQDELRARRRAGLTEPGELAEMDDLDELRPAGWRPHPPLVVRWVATALLALLLYLCHLQNFLFGLGVALVFILLAGVAWKRRGLAVLALLPAAAALALWRAGSEGTAGARSLSLASAWQAVREARLEDLGSKPWSVDVIERLRFLPVHALRGFMDWTDLVARRALLVVLAGYFISGTVALLTPPLGKPVPRMRLAGLLAVLAAVAAYLGLPHHLKVFDLMTFAPRFAVLVLALSLLLIPAGLRRLDRGARVMVVVPALVMGGLYGVTLVRHYRFYDQEVADFSAAVEKTPAGGRALGLVFDRNSRIMRIESALVGLPHLYPVLRPAAGSMTTLPYCGMRHIPCRPVAGGTPLPNPGPWVDETVDLSKAVDAYDYFFLRLPPQKPLFGKSLSKLEVVAHEGSWVVYGHRKPRAER